MGIERFRVVDKDEPVRTPIDELIGRRAQFYKGYLFYEKDFERSIPLEHGCTLRDIGGYVRSYVDELDAQHSTSRLQAERLRLSDGVEVDTHRLTQVARREAILIINAFGMPVDFWLQFMNRAGRQYDLYTWETRYLPGSGALCETDISMDRHVLDAVEILDRYDVGTAHVLGWCTGAKLALRMSLQYCNRVASLTMLSGGFNIGQEELRTAYERSASDILTDISASEDIAELYYDLIYNGNQHNSEADATARSILQATNANYVQYTSLPFSSPESIYRYAQLLTTFLEDREIGDLG
jgi:pimeloyl-ACP methyl ester carboxylesterase